MHTHTHKHTHTHTHTHIQTQTRNKHKLYTYRNTHTQTHKKIKRCTYIYTQSQKNIIIYIKHTHIHNYTHKQPHTQTHHTNISPLEIFCQYIDTWDTMIVDEPKCLDVKILTLSKMAVFHVIWKFMIQIHDQIRNYYILL